MDRRGAPSRRVPKATPRPLLDLGGVERSRLRALTADQQERFLPLGPTFVIELRSPSDSLASVEAKMREYMENGARLGWLIDPLERRVHVYRPDAPVDVLEKPLSVAGDPELLGFVLELAEFGIRPGEEAADPHPGVRG